MLIQNKTLYIRAAILLIGAALVLLAFSYSHIVGDKSSTSESINSIVVGENEFSVLIADTPLKRQKGLSDRPSLEENQGMLFIFEDSEVRYFWMKDMLFALDMIWIDENKKIVGITENVQPESFPESFSSKVPVKYVLEINSGGAERSGLKVGDIITFSK